MDPTEVTQALEAFFRPRRYRWYHAVAFGAAANLVSALAFVPRPNEQYYYEELNRPSWAPPSWAFPPAWAINNASELYGNLLLANLPKDTPDRQTILALQGASWFLYSTFPLAAFRTHSTLLSFAWSSSYWLLTIASAVLSRHMDRRITLSYAPLLAWLTLATALSGYIAAENPDPFFGTPALCPGRGEDAIPR